MRIELPLWLPNAYALTTLTVPPTSTIPLSLPDCDPSPDGRWWTLEQVSVDPDTVPWPFPTTLQVWNSETGASWVAAISGTAGVREHVWLPTNQLLWRDRGAVLLADADGSNRRDLAAPEPVRDILGVGANGVAVGEAALRRGRGSCGCARCWRGRGENTDCRDVRIRDAMGGGDKGSLRGTLTGQDAGR